MKKKTILLLVLVALFAGSLDARPDTGNPFGFETNKHPLEYDYCKKEPGLYRGHGYKCSSAPRPHPDFHKYVLFFVENVGLCSIQGTSSVFKAASHLSIDPAPADEKFQIFKGQIVQKYGQPTSSEGAEPMKEKTVASTKPPTPDHQPRKEPSSRPNVSRPETVEGYDSDEIDAYIKESEVWLADVNRARKALKTPASLSWSPKEGFKGLGHVKAIHLMTHHLKDRWAKVIHLTFWLQSSDACREKIEDMADRAF